MVLTLEKKLEVIKMLDKAVSYTIISEKFGIGHSTVGDIKKNRNKILQFSKEREEHGMKEEIVQYKWTNIQSYSFFLPKDYCLRQLRFLSTNARSGNARTIDR